MSERRSRSPALRVFQQKRSERSSSIDSFHMTSHEERKLGKVNTAPLLSDDEIKSLESQFSCSSIVRVDIADLSDLSGSQCMNITTHSLKKCKTHILVPYSRLLRLIGWKSFGKDIDGPCSRCGWKILNFAYVMFILLLVSYSYVYDIMSCQWKLDVRYDTRPTTTAKPVPTHTHTPHHTHSHHSNFSGPEYTVNGSLGIYPFEPNDISDAHNSSNACGHIVTTYIIPDLLHMAAYILGLWFFRVKENEHLYALVEKVFLATANMHSRTISPTKLISRLRFFFVMGVVWVVLTLCLQGLFVYSFGVKRDNILSTLTINEGFLWVLFGIDLLGVAAANCINLALVLNYSIQCEMQRYYINTVGARLKERSTDLKSAMRDVLNVREAISLLNSSLARMTSLAVISFAEMFIIGLCILILNEDNQGKVWLYRSLFPVVWAAILFFPLIQAANMNAACSKFKKVALNIRVYGYQNCAESELDSFLLFIANTTLRSKLFHIAVKPSYLLGVMIVTCFTLLLLFQTSYVGPAGRFF